MFKHVWFKYIVQSGDASPDLDYVSSSSLTLNGGTVKQYNSSFDATLGLPAPGASSSLGNNKAIVISTATPAGFVGLVNAGLVSSSLNRGLVS